MEERRYQIYLAGTYATEWTTLAKKFELPDGQVIRTKLLADGRLQYVRRNGVIGISDSQYMGGAPIPGQWREHPVQVVARPVFSRAQSLPGETVPISLPEGIEINKN